MMNTLPNEKGASQLDATGATGATVAAEGEGATAEVWVSVAVIANSKTSIMLMVSSCRIFFVPDSDRNLTPDMHSV